MVWDGNARRRAGWATPTFRKHVDRAPGVDGGSGWVKWVALLLSRHPPVAPVKGGSGRGTPGSCVALLLCVGRCGVGSNGRQHLGGALRLRILSFAGRDVG